MNAIVYSAVIRSKFKKEYNKLKATGKTDDYTKGQMSVYKEWFDKFNNSLKECPYIKIDKLDGRNN